MRIASRGGGSLCLRVYSFVSGPTRPLTSGPSSSGCGGDRFKTSLSSSDETRPHGQGANDVALLSVPPQDRASALSLPLWGPRHITGMMAGAHRSSVFIGRLWPMSPAASLPPAMIVESIVYGFGYARGMIETPSRGIGQRRSATRAPWRRLTARVGSAHAGHQPLLHMCWGPQSGKTPPRSGVRNSHASLLHHCQSLTRNQSFISSLCILRTIDGMATYFVNP
jgi:hypothetical protein